MQPTHSGINQEEIPLANLLTTVRQIQEHTTCLDLKMWVLPPKSDLTSYVHMWTSASCWIKTTQSNGKPPFIEHLKHHIRPHTDIYMKELQLKIALSFYRGMLKHTKLLWETAKLHSPTTSMFFHSHLAGTSQFTERWRSYHVARPSKKMH